MRPSEVESSPDYFSDFEKTPDDVEGDSHNYQTAVTDCTPEELGFGTAVVAEAAHEDDLEMTDDEADDEQYEAKDDTQLSIEISAEIESPGEFTDSDMPPELESKRKPIP